MDAKDIPPKTPKALEDAAKYICTMNCGKCPMAVEQFPCPQTCTMDIRPWQCWIAYFQQNQQALAEHE